MEEKGITEKVSALGEAWESFKAVNSARLEVLEKPRIDSEHAYFITSKERLTDEQYQRVRQQIDEHWPKNLPRPILLEACEVVKL
jgi:hypothetical protein